MLFSRGLNKKCLDTKSGGVPDIQATWTPLLHAWIKLSSTIQSAAVSSCALTAAGTNKIDFKVIERSKTITLSCAESDWLCRHLRGSLRLASPGWFLAQIKLYDYLWINTVTIVY